MHKTLGLALVLWIFGAISAAQAQNRPCLDDLLASETSNISHSAFFSALSKVVRSPDNCETVLAKAVSASGGATETKTGADLSICRAAQETWQDVRGSESLAVFEAFADDYADCPIYAAMAREMRRQGQAPVVATPAAKPPAPNYPLPPSWTLRNCTGVTAVNRQAELCFTSVLKSQSGNSYGPHNVIDGDHRTAWVEGAQGQGIGEAFTIVFDEPVLINRWSLRNGYAKSNKTYNRNSRVRELRLKFSNGKQTHFTMEDTPDWQGISALSEYGPVSWITFEITDVYPGTHYEDTAITELSFD